MKYFLLVGGFLGFVAAFASGISAGNDFTDVLCNSAIGCLCGAFLARGFRMLLNHQLRQVATQQSEAPALAAAAAPALAE